MRVFLSDLLVNPKILNIVVIVVSQISHTTNYETSITTTNIISIIDKIVIMIEIMIYPGYLSYKIFVILQSSLNLEYSN